MSRSTLGLCVSLGSFSQQSTLCEQIRYLGNLPNYFRLLGSFIVLNKKKEEEEKEENYYCSPEHLYVFVRV